MKIKFTKLPTTDGTIKISLDGGQSLMSGTVTCKKFFANLYKCSII